MGVQGRRPQRGIDNRFQEPALITNVETILKDAVDEQLIDGKGNLKLEEITAMNGIELVYESLPSNESGYFCKEGTHCRIGINNKHNKKRQRFTLAHELGHFFMHKDKDGNVDLHDEVFYRIDNTTSIEYAANEFAANLLMPRERIDNKIEEGITDLKELADFFEVSQEAMRYRVVSLGYIIEQNV